MRNSTHAPRSRRPRNIPDLHDAIRGVSEKYRLNRHVRRGPGGAIVTVYEIKPTQTTARLSD